MTDREEHADDGERPNEETGVESCDATADQCELTVKADEQDQADHVEGTWRDEVAESFAVEPLRMVTSPEDGLPTEADPVELSTAPAFTRENSVCVEDDREYVELFAEDLEGPRPSIAISTRRKYLQDGSTREPRRWNRSEVVRKFGVDVVPEPDSPDKQWVLVRPVRPRCKHYKRQLWLNQEMSVAGQTVKVVARNCMMRRTIGGAFLSVSNEAVFACDYRDPPDEETVRKHLDEPDQKKLDGPAPKMVPMFAGSGNVGGIFAPRK